MQAIRTAAPLAKRANKKNRVDDSIRHRIRECPYSFMFNRVDWEFDRGTLRLVGAVQSFYLKQILQELLRDVDHVRQIDNRVDVISPTGLSSVRPKQRAC